MNPGYFGIEIGGTKLQIVAACEQLKIHERRRFQVDRALGADGIRAQIQRALLELKERWSPLSVGVGFGGPVDWRTGRICCSHHVEGWSGINLAEWVEKLVGAPVRVDNDANTAALGEAMHGAGVGLNPVFYITLGSGVGGGLVVDGAIYHGATPGEAEIGHLRLFKDGTILEDRCSGWAVDRRIREAREKGGKGLLIDLAQGSAGGEARHLEAALQKRDPLAERILAETIDDLAFGLSHMLHLFHPEVIVIGGGLSLLGEPLRSGMESVLPRFTMKAFAPGPRICLAALGEDAVPMGALAAAKNLRST